jgi:hypothetical protein
MISNTDFDFVNSCIGKFETATFFNDDYSTCKVPNLLCKVKLLERNGNLIAVIPYIPINDEDVNTFMHGTIQFYKKNSLFYISLSGIGRVMKKENYPHYFEHLASKLKSPLLGREILLTFTINEINYVEVKSKPITLMEKFVKLVFKVFNQNPPHYRTKNIHSVHYNWG